ncbi:hypothetical protein HDU99_004043, partial [Rhizoclosmatium hyalinum]
TGIALSGGGTGGLVFSQLSARLLDSIGLAWTLRITAIICFVVLMAFVPFLKSRIPERKGKVSFSFLKRSHFYLLFVVCFFNTACEFIPLVFFPTYGQQLLDISLADGATILSFYNGFNILGRIAMGFIGDYMGTLNALILCCWLIVISLFSWLAASSLAALCVVGAAVGFSFGGLWGLFPSVLSEIFALDGSLITLIAVMYTLVGVGGFACPSVTGLIQEQFGLKAIVIFAGILAILAALPSTIVKFIPSSRS